MTEVSQPSAALKQGFREGVAQLEAGQWAGAEAIYRRLLTQWPNVPELHHNLGVALKNQKKLPEAMAAMRTALALRPQFADAWNNLGDILRLTGHSTKAMEAYQRALRLRPEFPDAWVNVGILLKQDNQPMAGVQAYLRALELKPDYPIALNNIVGALKDAGELEKALAYLDRAVAVAPDHLELQRSRLSALQYIDRFDAPAIYEEARRWNERFARPLAGEIPVHDNDPSPDRRLRVGYVSVDFRGHCMSLFLSKLLPHHDHDRFEVFCYSGVDAPDEVTTRIRRYADVWRDITDMTDQAAAHLIRQDKIDILVDLTLHLIGSKLFIFARKPAPVQVTWLGYPGTTGLETIDYRITDPRLDPLGEEIRNPKSDPGAPGRTNEPKPNDSDAEPEVGIQEPHYSERSYHLPDTFWCYHPAGVEAELDAKLPDPGPLPAIVAGRFTFGCLNNFCKVTDQTLKLWTQVFTALPNSRLVLMAPSGPPRQRILAGLGIAPERVQFVLFQPRKEYLATYRSIDLCLDTTPCNGHTTTLDSLWMGVPVITRVGRTIAGRAGWSQLHNLDLLELVAWTDEQYVKLAIDWAGDLERLSRMRAALRARMEQSPLMDGVRFTRNMESGYRQMWQAWCRKNRVLVNAK